MFPRLDARIAGNARILLHSAQTDDLVPVVHQLVDEPFQRKVGVVVLVRPAEERPAAARALVAFVLVVQREGEVGCIGVVEGVERDATFVGSVPAISCVPRWPMWDDDSLGRWR